MKFLILAYGKKQKVVTDEKYDVSKLEEILEDTFGDLTLINILKPCIISSYDIGNGKPHFFFKQHKAKNNVCQQAVYCILVASRF
jgi:patatin-like phospholipase/acyl hydrolase